MYHTIRYNDQLLGYVLNISLYGQYAALSATQSLGTNLGLHRCDSGEYPLVLIIHIRDVHKRELSKQQNLYRPLTHFNILPIIVGYLTPLRNRFQERA